MSAVATKTQTPIETQCDACWRSDKTVERRTINLAGSTLAANFCKRCWEHIRG